MHIHCNTDGTGLFDLLDTILMMFNLNIGEFSLICFQKPLENSEISLIWLFCLFYQLW